MDWLSRPGAGLHSVVDAHAASHPDSLAAIDDSGEWTYAQLRDASIRLAAVLQSRGVAGEASPAWSTQPQAPRPLALAMPRGRVWYALCLATWRLGVPLVAASDDMPDKKAERDRNTRIATELRPTTLVVIDNPEAALPSRPSDCAVFQVAELLEAAESVSVDSFASCAHVISPETVLMYAYTGGTTKHSKCVVVTNAMALWEMNNYPAVLRGSMVRSDRILQYSPAYWGASAFGQIDIGLTCGACIVFIPAPSSVDAVTSAVSQHGITVLGTVPSQLRGAFPGGPPKDCTIRVVLTWGEKLPVKLSRQWKQHATTIELLIASEYWLALHSHCKTWLDPADSIDKHILQPLHQLDMLLLGEDGSPTQDGQIGELLLAGPTVSPGYVGPDGCVGTGKDNESAYTRIDGRSYFRTRDRLQKLVGGGLIYCGRGDSLAKRGGVWVDLEAMESTAACMPGVAMAAIIATEEVHLFVVLEPEAHGPLLHLLERVKRAVGGQCRVHVMSDLPRNAATDKVDRRCLQERLAGMRTREVEWQTKLAQVQWTLLHSYLSWYLVVLLVVAAPTLALSPLADVPTILAMRFLLLPYFWAAWHYTLMTHTERTYYNWPLGPPDMMLLLASLLPSACLGPVLAAAFAVIGRKRFSKTFSAVRTSFWLVLSVALLWASVRERLPPSVSVLTCLVCACSLEPSVVPFFAGLPVTWLLIFPRLLAEDWIWRARCDYSWIRRFIMKMFVVTRPVWNEALPWDFEQAGKYWEVTRMSLVHLQESYEGLGITIDFWDWVSPLPSIAKMQNGDSDPHKAPEARSPMESALAGLVERAGGSSDAMVGMDSLQVITLAELIRKEMGKDVSVKDLLRTSDIKQLAAQLQAIPCSSSRSAGSRANPDDSTCEKTDAFGFYRAFTMAFPRHPVDWMAKHTGPGHLDMAALQRATDRLVARHSALRTMESPDEPVREAMDRAAAMWQLCSTCFGRDSILWRSIANAVGASLFACWPRTVVRSPQEARVKLNIPKGPRVRDAEWDSHTNDRYIFSSVKEQLQTNRWPFEIVVVPLYHGEPEGIGDNAAEFAMRLPPKDVSWYIYCHITHAYSDGASGQALFADLLRLYAEESGTSIAPVAPEPLPPEPLQLLQRRLRPSLRGRVPGQSDPNNDVFHEVLDEDWVKREGYSRRAYLTPRVAQSLRFAATEVLGCSVDIAWLAAIMGAMFRLFPDMPSFHLVLKCGCRDGPEERQMVGFLSENRVFSVDAGDVKNSTLLDVAHAMTQTRAQRAWRAPQPLESGMCVYINIVSAMMGSLPKGFEHLPKPSASPNRWLGPAYAHLNLRIDQLAANDWDIRIFHWDGAWGWHWSTHFVHALGGTIYDMVHHPTASLEVPPHRRADCGIKGWSKEEHRRKFGRSENGGLTAGIKRRENGESAPVDAGEPPAKIARCEEPAFEGKADSGMDVDMVRECPLTEEASVEFACVAPTADEVDVDRGLNASDEPPAKVFRVTAAANECDAGRRENFDMATKLAVSAECTPDASTM